MNLMYSSTRNKNEKVTASEAILKGLANDGGLFVPDNIPSLDVTMDELAQMSYQETAYVVMKQFLTDFTEEELKSCIEMAYDSKFDTETIRKNKISAKAVNDLWVCGYTPTQTITFWYGYDKLYKEHYSTTSTWNIRDRFYKNLAQNLFDKTGQTFKMPSSIEKVKVVKNSIPLKLASANTPESMTEIGYFRKGTAPKEVTTDFDILPSVNNIKSKVTNEIVELSWTGLSAEDMLNLNSNDSFGTLGYDIYV